MKKVLSVYTVIAVLLLLIVSQATSIVSANPWAFSYQINPPSGAIPPNISINSPQNNAVYSEKFNISLSVKEAQYGGYFSDIYDVTYTIDNESVTIPHNGDVLALTQYDTSFVAPNLVAGNHSLIVKATGIVFKPMQDFFLLDSSSQVYFVIRRAPSFELLTDQSANITFSSFPLNFTVDQPTSWLGYSLDNLANVTIGGNKTLTGLSAGNHSLVVYGNNTFGDMAKSETINFTAKEPEASLALTVIAPVVIAIIIRLGLLVYFKKRRKQS
jgi:hypothetical protein